MSDAICQDFWEPKNIRQYGMQNGGIELDGGGTSRPHTRVGATRHFSSLRNLQAGFETKLETIFESDRLLTHCQQGIGIEKERVVEIVSLIDLDPIDRRHIQFLQFF